MTYGYYTTCQSAGNTFCTKTTTVAHLTLAPGLSHNTDVNSSLKIIRCCVGQQEHAGCRLLLTLSSGVMASSRFTPSRLMLRLSEDDIPGIPSLASLISLCFSSLPRPHHKGMVFRSASLSKAITCLKYSLRSMTRSRSNIRVLAARINWNQSNYSPPTPHNQMSHGEHWTMSTM